jgi:predicted DNA-binding transcriptional regulator YafY
MERMLRIHQEIQSGKFPNANSLSRLFEISAKTIHRDLEFMRDRLRLPLAYNRERFGFYYTEEVTAFPQLQISEGELFALLVAEKSLQQYRGTPFEKPLTSAFQKMAGSLPDTISLNLADYDKVISFRTRAETLMNLKTFDLLAKAVGRRQQLKLTYRKPGQKQGEERVVDPYHLANINGEWFLFAYDHLRQDLRTFVPSRIQEAQLTGNIFERPQKFSVEKTLAGSFGVLSGKELRPVVIRFSPEVADYIKEKRWHPSQILRELPDGGVELEMKLSGLSEVERWILGWGGKAMVVKPVELEEAVKRAAKEILASSH